MWHLIETSESKAPGSISHHSSVVVGDKMFLYGGSNENGVENKHLFSLDLKSYKWEIINSVNKELVVI